jgi:hypothetical protein
MKPGVICLLVLCAFRLSAQDAGEMDVLLETPAVSGAQAARFVLGAAGLLPELSGQAAEAAAWDLARERGWASGSGNAALSLRETAFLVMGAFGFKGGVMYTLFPGPRYAYRELLYRKIIQGRADGGFTLSGERLLRIIGRALRHSGEDARLDAALEAGEGAGMKVPDGQGLSTGPEGFIPYRGEFEIE